MQLLIRSYLRKGEEIDYTYESSDSKSDPGTGASQGKRDDDGNRYIFDSSKKDKVFFKAMTCSSKTSK